MHVTGDIVLNLLRVIRYQGALFRCTLATLASSHVYLATREDICVAHVLSDKDFFCIVWLFIVEANKAEFITKYFR